MKENNTIAKAKHVTNAFVLVPEEMLEQLISQQDKILEILRGGEKETLNGFITEKQAKQILPKKSTWFWQMRKVGKLSYKKIGSTTYYSLKDINDLLQSN